MYKILHTAATNYSTANIFVLKQQNVMLIYSSTCTNVLLKYTVTKRQGGTLSLYSRSKKFKHDHIARKFQVQYSFALPRQNCTKYSKDADYNNESNSSSSTASYSSSSCFLVSPVSITTKLLCKFIAVALRWARTHSVKPIRHCTFDGGNTSKVMLHYAMVIKFPASQTRPHLISASDQPFKIVYHVISPRALYAVWDYMRSMYNAVVCSDCFRITYTQSISDRPYGFQILKQRDSTKTVILYNEWLVV